MPTNLEEGEAMTGAPGDVPIAAVDEPALYW